MNPVSEELLNRAIRANVELAQALGQLVRDIGDGLTTIQTHVGRLAAPRDEAQRASMTAAIETEVRRLQHVIRDIGQPNASRPGSARAPGPPQTPPTPPRGTTARRPSGRGAAAPVATAGLPPHRRLRSPARRAAAPAAAPAAPAAAPPPRRPPPPRGRGRRPRPPPHGQPRRPRGGRRAGDASGPRGAPRERGDPDRARRGAAALLAHEPAPGARGPLPGARGGGRRRSRRSCCAPRRSRCCSAARTAAR